MNVRRSWSYLVNITLGNAVCISMDVPDVLLAVRGVIIIHSSTFTSFRRVGLALSPCFQGPYTFSRPHSLLFPSRRILDSIWRNDADRGPWAGLGRFASFANQSSLH